jgi:hypothetical protein
VTDGVFSFNEIQVSADGIQLEYRMLKPAKRLTWAQINDVQLNSRGGKTAVLDIITNGGQVFHSARADVSILEGIKTTLDRRGK